MFPENIQKEIYKVLWLLLVLITGAVAYYYIFPAAKAIFTYLLPAFLPFIIALILAMLIDPFVEFTQRKFKINRVWATIGAIVLFILFFGAFLVFLISRLLVELNKLAEMIPIWSEWLSQYDAEALLTKIKAYYFSLQIPDYVFNVLQESLNSALKVTKIIVSSTINGLVGFVASLPYIFMVSIIILVATYFLSKDKSDIQRKLFRKFEPNSASKALNVMHDLNNALAGFFRAQTLLVSITGLQTIIGLSLLGVDYALTIGVITAFADLLPILGPGSIFVPWIIFELLIGRVRFAVALIVLYAIIVIVRQIIEPKILSQSIGLHPLATLMSIFVGLKLMGGWGIVLGPAVLVIWNSLRRAKII